MDQDLTVLSTARHGEDVALFVCIAVGAIAGFTVTGGAALGTALGAAAGMGVVALLREQRPQPPVVR